jgi:hypothetical protein
MTTPPRTAVPGAGSQSEYASPSCAAISAGRATVIGRGRGTRA